MPLSLSEEVAEVYYQKKGYFVTRNKIFKETLRSKRQPGNLDIDVLATNGLEVVIISCKRGSLSKEEEETEIQRFNKAEEFLKRDEKLRDFVKDLPIKKMYVAEYAKPNKKRLEQENIEVQGLEEMIRELIELLKNEMTPKMFDGAETKVLPRMLKFMIKHNLIKEH